MRSCCEALGTALERGRQESRMWGQWAGSLLAPLGQQILKKTKKISSRDGNTKPLTCLLRNLYAGQEITARARHGTTDWFQTGKGVQGCVLSACLFNVYAEYIV